MHKQRLLNFSRQLPRRMLAWLLLLAFASYQPAVHAEQELSVCVATDEWLPYFSWQDIKGAKLDAPIGISRDAIHSVFKQLNIKYQINPIVWSRLSNAVGNTHRNCDVIWDVTAGIAHKRNFLLSLPLYKMPASLIFDRNTFTGAQLAKMSLADLFKKRRNICGVRGYDYRELNSLVNVKVGSVKQAFDVMGHSRCSLFFLGTPVFEHGFKNGIWRLGSNIDYLALGPEYTAFYFLALTNRDAKSLRLLDAINSVIVKMQTDGSWERLFMQYGVQSYIDLRQPQDASK